MMMKSTRVCRLQCLSLVFAVSVSMTFGFASAGELGNLTNVIEVAVATAFPDWSLVERDFPFSGEVDYSYSSGDGMVYMLVNAWTTNWVGTKKLADAKSSYTILSQASGISVSTNWSFGDEAVSLDCGSKKSMVGAWYRDIYVSTLCTNFPTAVALCSNVIEAVESVR